MKAFLKSEEKKREKERVASLTSVPPTPPTPAQGSENAAVSENDDGVKKDVAQDEPATMNGAEPSDPEKPTVYGQAEPVQEAVCG